MDTDSIKDRSSEKIRTKENNNKDILINGYNDDITLDINDTPLVIDNTEFETCGIREENSIKPDCDISKIENIVNTDNLVKDKNKEHDKNNTSCDNNFNKESIVELCGSSNKDDSTTNRDYIKIDASASSENSSITNDIAMMTLGTQNPLFMQPKSLHGQAIYCDQDLPKFLEDSINEKLSKIVIGSNEADEKVIEFVDYQNEEQLPDLTSLIAKDLSEPYSVYTYRYFLHNWPSLSFLAYYDTLCVGSIVCKLDQHRKNIWRGYIAMLVVHKDYRRYKIGSKLVQKAIRRMIHQGCDEVVLETEVTNRAALNLYENLGFVRDKRLLRYYLNGVDAWRLKLWLR